MFYKNVKKTTLNRLLISVLFITSVLFIYKNIFHENEIERIVLVDVNIQNKKYFTLSSIKHFEIDSLKLINDKLKDNKYDVIDLVSHGENGQIILDKEILTLDNIDNHKKQLNFIGEKLSASGHINILGCDVAKNEDGKALIDKIAEYTGASVAASINPTGNKIKGGDWDLEYITHQKSKHLSSLPTIYENYSGILYDPATYDPLTVDTDLDGVMDAVDIDDDNDGILDVDEGYVCSNTPVFESAWDIKVYQGGSGPSCGDQLGIASVTEIASGTMDEFPGELRVDWYNGGSSTLLATLNNNGGNVTGSNPTGTHWIVRHEHTFNAGETGVYDLLPSGTTHDSKMGIKVAADGTETLLFCTAAWTQPSPGVTNIQFDEGDKLRLYINEYAGGNQGLTINLGGASGQTYCTPTSMIDSDNDGIPNLDRPS